MNRTDLTWFHWLSTWRPQIIVLNFCFFLNIKGPNDLHHILIFLHEQRKPGLHSEGRWSYSVFCPCADKPSYLKSLILPNQCLSLFFFPRVWQKLPQSSWLRITLDKTRDMILAGGDLADLPPSDTWYLCGYPGLQFLLLLDDQLSAEARITFPYLHLVRTLEFYSWRPLCHFKTLPAARCPTSDYSLCSFWNSTSCKW